MHKCVCHSTPASRSFRASEVAVICATDRHTPLGVPVLPEVKVILAVSSGIRGPAAETGNWRNQTPCPRGSSPLTSSLESMPSRLACPIRCAVWVSEKNTGTGTQTTPANRQARSASIQATCLLYTSDAADDLLCVDLGGRR